MSSYILRRDRDSNSKALRPVRPNLGIEVAYRRRLYDLIEKMHESCVWFLKEQYKKLHPEMAMDATPASELAAAVQMMVRQWQYNFDQAATELAHYFAQDVSQRSDAALLSALRKGGFAVDFVMTPAMRDVIDATVHANVALIKSIPQQYLGQVEGMVMRSVQTGRDMGTLAKELETQLGVTKKRAALISRSQNNMATSALTRVRQKEMGITTALWLHSHGGRTQRATHVAMNKKPYDINKGFYDENARGKGKGDWVFPGQLINCKCVSQSIIPGLET